MSFLKKLNEQNNNEPILPTDPNKLFYSLNKKEEGIEYLRDGQNEVLENYISRKGEKYLLIKMNTGAGKTLVGLLILYSKMLESKEKVIFLCPDKQLVDQAYQQSKKYDIPTCVVEESSSNEFPEDFLNNKAILITTIQRLFNSKNIFERDKIIVNSIVIDDAHKCVEKVKDAFTVKIPSNIDLYKQLIQLFSDEFKKQSEGTFSLIDQNPNSYMKLPFWSWLDKKTEVINLLKPYAKNQNILLFKEDWFFSNYEQYELYFNFSTIEITPLKCFVDSIRTYKDAKHIYALSATFENNDSLLFDLNFSVDSIINPIEPKNINDYGQRLVLSPERYCKDFDSNDMKEIIQYHLSKEQNILVLVPSFKEADLWEQLGAKVLKENIEEELERVKNTKKNFVVVVNRYEGIDLGGKACNVLIIHNVPKYKFIKERYYETINYTLNSNLTAQTIEQGMGRIVRSGNDFGVVYLLGRNILKFLREKDNFKYLNNHTKKEIEIGIDLLSADVKKEDIVKTICEITDEVLSQDDSWLTFYQNGMSKKSDNPIQNKKDSLEIKEIERDAIQLFNKGRYEEAISLVDNILNNKKITDEERAIYLTLSAYITYGIDKNKSNDLVIKSNDYSRYMFEPFLAREYSKKQLKVGNQFEKALTFIQKFLTINDAIATLNEILPKLVYNESNPADEFEKGLKELGDFLGFESSRPEKEYGKGCDNLWILDNETALIMEAKSQKKTQNIISKEEMGQLMQSIQWFKDKYVSIANIYGVSLQYNNQKEPTANINNNIKVIDNLSLSKLTGNLCSYRDFLSKNNISNLSKGSIKLEFDRLCFSSDKFVNTFLKNIIERK
jgi:Superfamily II helicase